MYISRLAFVLAALSAASCIDKDVDNTEFYEKYAPIAIEQQLKYGIPASVTLALMV